MDLAVVQSVGDAALHSHTELALSNDFGKNVARGVLAIASYAGLGLVLLLAGFYILDLATPGELSALIRHERNPNAGLIAAAGIFGIGLIVAASILGSGGRLLEGLLATAAFGVTGIVAQVVAVFIFDKLVRFDVRSVVSEAKLCPSAIVLATAHVSIGLVTALAVL